MKILHIISSGGMYGAEAVILNLSRTLNEAGHQSILGVFANSPNPNLQLHEIAIKEGMESHLILCRGQVDRGAPGRIRELASKTRADVIHAHGYKADIYVYVALRSGKIPLVSTCHTWYDNDLAVSVYGAIDRFVLRGYSHVVSVSKDAQNRLLKAGVRAEKITVIGNGIDLRPFSRPSEVLKDELGLKDCLVVGLVGRLSVEKGIDIFIRAAANVLKEIPAAKFVVAGDGPDRGDLEGLIDKLGIRESVRLLGRREDMPSVYSSFDVMVSASRQEGLPIALLEGMASSRAIVATSVGEVPTIIHDGVTGVLVSPERVELLAAAIEDLLTNPAKREKLGSAARQLVEDEFSANRMMADYRKVYESASVATAGRSTERLKTSGAQ